MKNLIFAITLILGTNVCAQNIFENNNVFVRVYDLQGKKISKGNILSISDSLLLLKGKREPMKIATRSIGLIKTKHSGGNNVLKGALIGATGLAILMVATAGEEGTYHDAAGGAAAGVFVGGIFGAAVGGVTSLFKNSKTYEINGDKEKWEAFKATSCLPTPCNNVGRKRFSK